MNSIGCLERIHLYLFANIYIYLQKLGLLSSFMKCQLENSINVLNMIDSRVIRLEYLKFDLIIIKLQM